MAANIVPHPPGLGDDLGVDLWGQSYGNDTHNTSTAAPVSTTTPRGFVPLSQPPCQLILYEDIRDSRVRIWDLIILIPNILFLIFLLVKFRTAIIKLRRTSSPIFLAFYGLVFVVAVISVLRSVVSMTVNIASVAGDYSDRVLWLVLRFFLLATELSVVIFGLAFGQLDSRTSIQRVLLVTFSIALMYSCTQGVLEFVYEDHSSPFQVITDSEEYTIFGHGGMLFWFASSVFFFVIYFVICLLPCTNCRERFALPTKKSFYLYCFILAVLNAIQAAGSGMLYYQVKNGMCLVDASTYSYFTCFAPLVYGTFLWEFFRSTHPPDILFSYKAHNDEEDDDDHVSMPHQGAAPHHKPLSSLYRDHDDDTAGGGAALSSSFDSTQIDAPISPNPLYAHDEDFHFSPELTINSEYLRDEHEVIS